jgi:hypothetical protein
MLRSGSRDEVEVNFLALALAVSAADLIPIRWNSPDPAKLELVRATPANCLLLEQKHWSGGFVESAGKAGIASFGVVREFEDPATLSSRLQAAGMAGAVLEGKFEPTMAAALRKSGLTVVEMGPRTRMRLDEDTPIVATNQGVWPGINSADDGSAKAAPSGAPWIDTNSGFLRFVRSSTKAEIWIGYRPPAKQVIPVARYLQAIADAAMVGARWVVTLDDDFEARLLDGDAAARKDWIRMGELLAFYQKHRDWGRLEPFAQLALVQDSASGGLISGGILDMISVKHTPVRPVPVPKLDDREMRQAKMAVNVDPARLDEPGKEVLRRFTRAGGTLLTAPPGWKFPVQRDDQITLDKEDIEKLDQIWKEVNSMTGRRNLGARLFNVASMLSDLVGPPEGKPLVLQLVNYSDYPAENVTVHVLGKFTRATLYEPGAAPRDLAVYEHEEGSGIDIDQVSAVASLVLE